HRRHGRQQTRPDETDPPERRRNGARAVGRRFSGDHPVGRRPAPLGELPAEEHRGEVRRDRGVERPALRRHPHEQSHARDLAAGLARGGGRGRTHAARGDSRAASVSRVVYFSTWAAEGSRDRRSCPPRTTGGTTSGGVIPGHQSYEVYTTG